MTSDFLLKKIMNNFLIIIPTNREKFIKNISNYYSKTRLQVIVVHNLEKNFGEFETKNIKFYFSDKKNILERVLDISDKINTEYSLIFSDDDFILEESVYRCIEFLNKNPEFSSAQSLCFNFSYENLSSLNNQSGINTDLINRQKDSKNNNIRLFQSLTYRYVDRVYSIVKTECLLDLINSFKPLMKNYRETWELFHIVCLTLKGRDFIDQQIGWFKGQHLNNLHKFEKNDITTWIFEKKFQKLFYDCLKKFSKKQNINNYSSLYLTIIFYIFKFKVLLSGNFLLFRKFLNFLRYRRCKKIKNDTKIIFLKYLDKVNIVRNILN
jgi:hypothetical protein